MVSMLQRTLTRSLLTTRHGCAVCTCRCGALISSSADLVPALNSHQRRTKYTYPRAPSTRRKAIRSEPRILNLEEARKRRQGLADTLSRPYRIIQELNAQGLAFYTPDQGRQFLNAFADLTVPVRGKNAVEVQTEEYQTLFAQLLEQSSLTQADALQLALVLVRLDDDDRLLGKKLLFALSAAGNQEATMSIMSHALGQAQSQLTRARLVSPLRSKQTIYARGHLREIAREGENYRAMVLEGKIAHELGDDDYAIQMWNQAMSAAVEVSERQVRLKAAGASGGVELRALERRAMRDVAELSTPWIELTMIHYERCIEHYKRGEVSLALGERKKMEDANQIGCEQDDPTSHYHAADYLKEVDEYGDTRYTSSWLYHMTKAGGTGHVVATFKLAEFYFQTGWKYIEDEPPDHVKPTAFDSYPAPEKDAASKSSPLSNLRRFLGLQTAVEKAADEQSSLSPEDNMFQLATFPSTPEERLTLAMQWLEAALRYSYAPAHLLAARIYLKKELWGQAGAPASALQLQPARYTYASQEDYAAGKPITTADPIPEPPDVPNPLYSLPSAKHHILQIFYAAQAIRTRTQRLRSAEDTIVRRAVKGIDAEAYADVGMFSSEISKDERKFLVFKDVREIWEPQIEELERQARQICEEEGWDLWDEKGGLVYRHGIGGEPAEG